MKICRSRLPVKATITQIFSQIIPVRKQNAKHVVTQPVARKRPVNSSEEGSLVIRTESESERKQVGSEGEQ